MRGEDASRHARERMRERLGVDLTPELAADLLARIAARRLPVEKEDREANVTVYRASVAGQVCRVVYSHRTRQIMTVTASRLLTYPKDPRNMAPPRRRRP